MNQEVHTNPLPAKSKTRNRTILKIVLIVIILLIQIKIIKNKLIKRKIILEIRYHNISLLLQKNKFFLIRINNYNKKPLYRIMEETKIEIPSLTGIVVILILLILITIIIVFLMNIIRLIKTILIANNKTNYNLLLHFLQRKKKLLPL